MQICCQNNWIQSVFRRLSYLDNPVDCHSSLLNAFFNIGEDSDVSMAPSPCSLSSSRGVTGAREVAASVAGSGISYGPGFSNSGPFSGIVSNNYNASGTVLTTGHAQSNNGATSRLHIPRATYNKEVGSARNNRLRRSNAGSTASSSVAAVAAMAAGSQIGKSLSYQLQTTAAASIDPFPNSATLARYAHTSPGRSLHHSVSVSSLFDRAFSTCDHLDHMLSILLLLWIISHLGSSPVKRRHLRANSTVNSYT